MKPEKEILERCGYCGSYFKGVGYLTTEQLEICEKELGEFLFANVPLGYCPNAMQEHYEQNPE